MGLRDTKSKFVNFKGNLFKKTHRGLHPAPHCPACRLPMFSIRKEALFVCSTCGHNSGLTREALDAVLEEVANIEIESLP